MANLPTHVLEARLADQARGSYADEAAVDLLARHGRWLDRDDFIADCVIDDGDRGFARIDWDVVPAFVEEAPCSSSEARVLALAAELGGTDTGRPLAELLVSLDDANSARVIDAIAHALGQHDRGGAR